MTTENTPGSTVQSTTGQMGKHPDIVAMGARYDRMAETPTAQLTDGLTMLAGLFVALSPWIVGFTQFGGLTVSNLVVGLVIAGLGACFALAYERSHRLTWVCPLLGAWTIVSIWAITGTEFTTSMALSNIIGGGVVVLLGLAAFVPFIRARRESRS
ncbi:SPW repeat protein [Haloechinothrix sp. YIM 98757]|uniref:SPW repeat protein n=1 Tax=Haloechinothrix aidingensis TaxID=2752311 RepID=A0A838A8K3_9PSEU|nr:SPW repeat protein [Haloechinothrix aidingensis]MBA0125097.1 SPW repeat protein [Haloechinothrix aidingensis]